MERKMTFKQKLLEIVVQVCWVPISAFFNATTVSPILLVIWFIYFGTNYAFGITTVIGLTLCWLPIFLEKKYILPKLKHFEVTKGKYYNVEPTTKVSTYEGYDGSIKVNIDHDDGKRYERSGSELAAIYLAVFALPLRCISLLLSIFALFIPPLNIKIKNNHGGFSGLALDVM